MKIQIKRRLSTVLVGAVVALGLAVVPAVGAQAQGIVYKTYCGVQYTGFSNQGATLATSTRRASAGCGGSIFTSPRSLGSITGAGTLYSAGDYVTLTAGGVYSAPGGSHGSPAGTFSS